MRVSLGVGCIVVLVVSGGCTETLYAQLTRVIAPEASGLAAAPVCFPPPDPALGLTERSNADLMRAACERALRLEHVAVASYGTPGCLGVTTSWSSRRAGFVTSCSGYLCEAKQKTLRVTLSSAEGKALLESTVSIASERADFTEQTYFGLCRAAFRDYPQPFRNASIDVDLE